MALLLNKLLHKFPDTHNKYIYVEMGLRPQKLKIWKQILKKIIYFGGTFKLQSNP